MIKLNLFAISGLTIIFTFSPMIFLVAKEIYYKKKENLLPYLIYLASISFWGIASLLIGLTQDYNYAKYLWKYAYSIVVFISVFFYHALISVNNLKRPKTLIFLYISGFIFTLLTLNNFLPGHPKFIFNSVYYPERNILFDIHFTLWSLTILGAYIEVFILLKKSINKKQNLILLLGSPIAFLGGLLNHGNSYNISIYPIGNFFVAASSLIYTYGILCHEFLDIRIIIRRGLVYSILVSLMTLSYIVVVVAAESFLQNIFGYHSVLVKILTAFSFGLTLIPLRNKIQQFVDQRFFKGSAEELSEQIQKYSVQAQESDKYKMAAKLAGNVAHEIKNPLTAIRTFIEEFPNRKNDPDFLNKFQKLASSELGRIQNLSMQLTDFARPAALKLSAFDAHNLLNDVLLLTNQRLINQNIKLNKQFTSEPLMLTGDKDQLKQVFLNLILNAMDAMESGGMLTVGTNVDDPARARRALPLQNIQITITDTGCGISPENLKKLFEPFFTTKSDGTGLGLSICKRIVETHGGRIDVSSVTNKGTTFSIILPARGCGGADA